MKFKGIPIKEISLFKTPLIYLELTAYILKDLILWFGKFFVEKIVFIMVLAFIYLMISLVGFLHVKKLLLILFISLSGLQFTGFYWEQLLRLGLALVFILLSFISDHILQNQQWLQLPVEVFHRCYPQGGISSILELAIIQNLKQSDFLEFYLQFRLKVFCGVLGLHQVNYHLILLQRK